ncbi:hypothetical protein ZWY2020_009397 [Hordeum vulgare]|nr:hypothetical protein ZWY2020_009397 [Hordeum vulgare]
MRCMPPRSPNLLLDRDGAATATAHQASCEVDAAKTGDKGSDGLSCHRCTEQFNKWEALEAHHLSQHADVGLHSFKFGFTRAPPPQPCQDGSSAMPVRDVGV